MDSYERLTKLELQSEKERRKLLQCKLFSIVKNLFLEKSFKR